MPFRNREEAGRGLAEALENYRNKSETIVLALPRGGVPVAYQVAVHLGLPLDVLLVRKLGVPGHPELAMGAIAGGGIEVLNEPLVRELGIPRQAIEQVAISERQELERRDRAFRGDRGAPVVRSQTVIVVDDGLATGATMEAAVTALRGLGAAAVVVAVPVGAPETCQRLAALADRVVCLTMPEPLQAVGQWYEDFSQTTDEEVRQLLANSEEISRNISHSKMKTGFLM
jgi:putative phosphoribosyl transferase